MKPPDIQQFVLGSATRAAPSPHAKGPTYAGRSSAWAEIGFQNEEQQQKRARPLPVLTDLGSSADPTREAVPIWKLYGHVNMAPLHGTY